MNSTKATLTKILTFILVAYAANTFNLGPRFAPWEYDVSGRTFAEYYKAIDFYMGKRMPIVILSFMAFQLLFLGLQWKNRSEWSFRCVALALVIQIATTIVLINTNHAEMNDWDPDHLPANWQNVRDEWLSVLTRNYFFSTTYCILVFMGCYFYWTRSGGNRFGETQLQGK